jgi:hypothetical protein
MSEVNKISASEQKKEDWMNAKWRPMMGWMYMLVCTFDFVVFPVLWSLVQAWAHGSVQTQWSPVTLQGAGLFHMAMGAVIGVAAFGRTQEKLAGKANDNSMPATFGEPSAPAFGGSPAPAFGAPSAPAFGSKPAGPGPTSFPAL